MPTPSHRPRGPSFSAQHRPPGGGAQASLARAGLLLGIAALSASARGQQQEPAQPAQTVTVTGRKAPVDKQLDKTVYDVANAPRAANGTAQDVLQATPEVSVAADGRIAVKGNTQVTVLVDGKPTAMLSGSSDERATALQTMSGADIASVEVITNPSAAHDAKGGAILNIVLKRNRKPGAHAQVQGSASDDGLWNVGVSGDATGERLSVHGNVALRHDGTRKIRASALEWFDAPGGQGRRTWQTSEVFVRRIVDTAALGADYLLSSADTLSLQTRYTARRSNPSFDVLNQERTGADATVYHRISHGPNTQSDGSASLAFSRHAQDTALKAMVQHSATEALVDKSYRDVYVEPLRDTAYDRGATRSARRLDQATLDWSDATAHGQWGAGLDLQEQVDAIRNFQATVDPVTRAETPDPSTTNDYAVRTTVGAAYLTYQLQRGAWEVLLGGRAERTALNVAALAPTRWQAFDPSLHMKYGIDARTSLTLGYRRSLQAPDPRDLDPFTTYVDAQNRSRGNPALRPQRLASWELGAERDFGKASASVGAFYRASRDTVTDARTIVDGVIVTSKQNGGRARASGMTASLDWSPWTGLRLGADGGAYRVALASPDLGAVARQDALVGYVNLRAAYSAGHDDVSLDAHAQSAGIAPLGRYGATSSVNLGWKHAMSRTLSVTVNANDLFDGSRRTYSTDTDTFHLAGFDHFVGRRIYVGLVQKIE